MIDMALDTPVKQGESTNTSKIKARRGYRSRKEKPQEMYERRPVGNRSRTRFGNINIDDKTSVYIHNPQEDNKIGVFNSTLFN